MFLCIWILCVYVGSGSCQFPEAEAQCDLLLRNTFRNFQLQGLFWIWWVYTAVPFSCQKHVGTEPALERGCCPGNENHLNTNCIPHFLFRPFPWLASDAAGSLPQLSQAALCFGRMQRNKKKNSCIRLFSVSFPCFSLLSHVFPSMHLTLLSETEQTALSRAS